MGTDLISKVIQFKSEVMPNVGKMFGLDLQNLNELGMALENHKRISGELRFQQDDREVCTVWLGSKKIGHFAEMEGKPCYFPANTHLLRGAHLIAIGAALEAYLV